jgi:putative protein kinase ArgK-like GTPase of G3E family
LTRTKHSLPGDKAWYCPVELVSANENFNVESIWETALKFRDTVGEDYLLERRQQQAQRAMWKYLGQAVMTKLKNED